MEWFYVVAYPITGISRWRIWRNCFVPVQDANKLGNNYLYSSSSGRLINLLKWLNDVEVSNFTQVILRSHDLFLLIHAGGKVNNQFDLDRFKSMFYQ